MKNHVFRRFGGTFQGNDGGSLLWGLVGAAGLVVFSGLTLYTRNVDWLLAGFAWLFVFTVISLFGKGGATAGLKDELYREYLSKAQIAEEQGDIATANKYRKRASRHGPVPPHKEC